MGPLIDSESKNPIWRHKWLDADGIAVPGAHIDNKQVCLIYLLVSVW